MFSKHPWIAPALAAALGWSGSAAAQSTAGTGGIGTSTGAIVVRPRSVGDEDVNTMVGVQVGLEDCEANVPVRFTLDNVPASKESIDVYIGDNCSATDRTDDTNNRCRYIPEATTPTMNRTQDVDVIVPASALFENGCDQGVSGKPTLWFLAVRQPNSAEELTRKDVGTIVINADTRPPDAPTGLKGGSGEHEIRVDWDSNEVDLEKFILYIDRSPTAGPQAQEDGGPAGTGDCGSSVLVGGAPASSVPAGFPSKTISEGTATGIDLNASDVGGTMAAVAVVAVDEAGNRSPLSNVGCVKVVATEGFWDRYKANGGEAQGGCPCRASAKAELQAAWPIGFALLWLRRRGARRRSA